MKTVLAIGLYAQAIALLLGMALHASALIAGREMFYARIFAPATDLVFVPFIFTGGVAGIAGLVRHRKRPAWLWVAGLLVSAYFVISIPIHVRTLVAWSTAHFQVFPHTYSIVVIPLQLIFLLVVVMEIRTFRR